MDNWHKILAGLLVSALIYIILMQGCGIGRGDSNCPEIDTTAIDTVRYESFVDTIWLHNEDTIYRYISVKVPVPYYDTVYVPDEAGPVVFDEFDDILLEQPWVYKDSVSDDTISIVYEIRTWGHLENIKLGYRPLARYYIEKRSILETAVTKTKRPGRSLYAGLNVGINKTGLSHLAPMFEFVTPKTAYNLGYDITDKAVIGGVKFRLRFGRK